MMKVGFVIFSIIGLGSEFVSIYLNSLLVIPDFLKGNFKKRTGIRLLLGLFGTIVLVGAGYIGSQTYIWNIKGTHALFVIGGLLVVIGLFIQLGRGRDIHKNGGIVLLIGLMTIVATIVGIIVKAIL